MAMERLTATEWLKRLVATPSVEPTQTKDASVAGEERMGRVFAEAMQGMGYALEWQWVAPGRPNVLAKGGAKDGKIWLLESHMDTVGTEGMTCDPFAAEVREGKLHGRGASDCKGGMAAALAALSRVDLAEVAARGEQIWYLGTMGEETGNNGARASLPLLPERIWRTVVLEPTESAVVHASKGIAAIAVELVGRSAHGSNPEQGVNAIYAAGEFARRLLALAVSEGERYGNGLVGKPSVNVGMISGGIAPNVVAPRCRVEFDWRVVPPETIGEVKDKIAGILDGLKSEGRCLGWKMEQFQNNDALSTPGDSALVEELAAACRASGLEGRTGGVRWCCDASVFCGRSGETVVFGPGSIKQGHASDEWIDVEELEKAADALALLLGGKTAGAVG